MKVNQLIAQYLFLHKTVTLQGIGRFNLTVDVPSFAESDKLLTLSENAISFEFDIKAQHDDNFISFVMQQTGKIKPLATSDLESYLILGKQFLNIGKPFVLHNIGSIVKTQSGSYEFIQTNIVTPEGAEQFTHPQEKDKNEHKINFSSPRKKSPEYIRYLPVILASTSIILILSILISIILNNKKDEKISQVKNVTKAIQAIKPDSSNLIKPDSLKKISQTLIEDSSAIDYKIVVRKYNDQISADQAFIKLSNYGIGKNLIKYKKDSSTFLLAIPFRGKLSDTLKVRDSIKVLFGKNAFIDFN